MHRKILFIDTETGGLNPEEVSLLSIGLVVWNESQIIETKEILIKQDVFHITPQSILTNRINFFEFLDMAIDADQAFSDLKGFLQKHFSDEIGKIVLGGHNTNFDVNFIRKFISQNGGKFEDWFGHRFVDTASILKFLYYSRKLDTDLSSSDNAFRYFNIEVERRHTALDDAIATARLFNHLIEIVK